jgi:cobalt transporter subunit CbtB
MISSLAATTASLPTRVSARVAPALVAFALGLTLFVTTGFAWPTAIHNATHDMRHSLGLPCH